MYWIQMVFQKRLTVALEQVGDHWIGSIYELPPSRYGACSVLFFYAFPNLKAAKLGLQRKWKELFPNAKEVELEVD